MSGLFCSTCDTSQKKQSRCETSVTDTSVPLVQQPEAKFPPSLLELSKKFIINNPKNVHITSTNWDRLPIELQEELQIFSWKNAQNITTIHTINAVTDAVFNPSDTMICWATNNIQLLDDKNEIAHFGDDKGYFHSVQFSPDDKTICSASSYDQTVRLWDVNTKKEIAELKGHTDWVNSAQFSRDGTLICSTSNDETIRLWDVNKLQEIAVLMGHTDWVKYAAFSPDDKTICSASDDNTVRLWDVNTKEQIAKLKGHTDDVNSVQFSPNGKLICSASNDHTVRLWDVASRKEVAVLMGHANYVKFATFSPDGKLICSASGKTIQIWDVDTLEQIAVLKGHNREVSSARFSPDGKKICSASYDKTVRLWQKPS